MTDAKLTESVDHIQLFLRGSKLGTVELKVRTRVLHALPINKHKYISKRTKEILLDVKLDSFALVKNLYHGLLLLYWAPYEDTALR